MARASRSELSAVGRAANYLWLHAPSRWTPLREIFGGVGGGYAARPANFRQNHRGARAALGISYSGGCVKLAADGRAEEEERAVAAMSPAQRECLAKSTEK